MIPPSAKLTLSSPNSPYSASKAASDHLVRVYHPTYGLPVLTTNCSNNYGPYLFPEKLIPLVIHNALADKSLPIYGDGQQVRDWLMSKTTPMLSAACVRLVRLARPTTSTGGTRNRTSMSSKPSSTILNEFSPRPDGRSYREQITLVTDRPGHDQRYAINASKIERELGWRPAETFVTGIRKTVSWYLDHQE